jgi:geranylgeranyl pyrophosphate synthase
MPDMWVSTSEGQALELGWRADNNCDVTAEDYLRLVLKKTGWYSFIHPMRVGSLFSARQDLDVDRFNAFGYLLSAAFQIQDDVLNLTGDVSRYGKEIGGDLSEGKRTLILSHALGHAPPEQRQRLLSFFGTPGGGRLPRQIAYVSSLLRDLGSIEWVQRVAADLANAAQNEFAKAYAGAIEGPDLDFLRSIPDYVKDRDL